MDSRLIFALTLVLYTVAAGVTCCRGYYSDSVPYVPRPEKVTYLHFFVHDSITGENPTSVLVARPNITILPKGALVPFGSVFVSDDPLTVGPDPTSEVIGNAQGLMVSTGEDVLSLTVYWDFGFTQGKFKGSSFSILSRNPITQTQRELAVVGGRGKFRMATGFALLKTYSSNNGNAVVEYNVTLIHHLITSY